MYKLVIVHYNGIDATVFYPKYFMHTAQNFRNATDQDQALACMLYMMSILGPKVTLGPPQTNFLRWSSAQLST